MNPEEFEHYKMQEALQQGQLDHQNLAYAPQALEQIQQSQAVLVEQTNPKRVVKDIILRLRGLEESPDGTLVKVATPKINEIGQDNIWFILDSHINQNVILSHLEEEEIRKIMDGLQDDLVDDLCLNWKEYGITKKTDLDTINNSVLMNIFMALKRAEGQNEKNWLGKISVENITGQSRLPQIKKEGWLSKFRL
ncbi:MAG: hypothetical protein KKB31_01405 [Nanoarchaeota archaeon]|nr:hypothetical protein [Nanoarchaeota archaeon]